MKYEIKFIHPLPVLINSLLVFLVIGVGLGLVTVFIFPNPVFAVASFGQKLMGFLTFILVWDLLVTGFVVIACLLYNFFAAKVKGGVTFFLEQAE